jgi:predicted nucleic acid-binding protein
MILVDTSVLLDVFRDDQRWEPWSTNALDEAARRDTLAINPVIYAELSSQFDRIEELDAAILSLALNVLEIPRSGLFLAGHAYRRYRRLGGTKTNVLSDFFIGAHAAVARATLLTRDVKRVRPYFPTVTLISP